MPHAALASVTKSARWNVRSMEKCFGGLAGSRIASRCASRSIVVIRGQDSEDRVGYRTEGEDAASASKVSSKSLPTKPRGECRARPDHTLEPISVASRATSHIWRPHWHRTNRL